MKISVIGAGFYGSYLACYFAKKGHEVTLYEQRSGIMQEASFWNQLKIHRGYHYPRSLETIRASKKNYNKFIKEFRQACNLNINQNYAIAKDSKVLAEDFYYTFTDEGCKLVDSTHKFVGFANLSKIQKIFQTEEASFNPFKLRDIMLKRLIDLEVELKFNRKVSRDNIPDADHTYFCTYAEIEAEELYYKDTQMIYLESPEGSENLGFTVMDGDFFSFTPMPGMNCHGLSHVSLGISGVNNQEAIIEAASEYLPLIRECRILNTVIQCKALLKQTLQNDGRPIYIKQTSPFTTDIVAGKIDNIYDLIDELEQKESNKYVIRS